MAMYCSRARIVNIEGSTCGGCDRADATEWCGKILMVNEEEMENRRDAANDPATNLSPIVSVQV
jgi:RNA polymerase subunit RPABC4/transcription elongation factor Spt4